MLYPDIRVVSFVILLGQRVVVLIWSPAVNVWPRTNHGTVQQSLCGLWRPSCTHSMNNPDIDEPLFISSRSLRPFTYAVSVISSDAVCTRRPGMKLTTQHLLSLLLSNAPDSAFICWRVSTDLASSWGHVINISSASYQLSFWWHFATY